MGRVSSYAKKKKKPLRARGWWAKMKGVSFHPTDEVLWMVGWQGVTHKAGLNAVMTGGK